MTSLSQKSINNSLTRANSSEIASYFLPSNKTEDLTLGASGTKYIAPANGWVWLDKSGGGSNAFIDCSVFDSDNNWLYSDSRYKPSSPSEISILFPVKKGNEFTVTYNAIGTVYKFKFIYAIGSEREATQ